jgi:hypothetical protein
LWDTAITTIAVVESAASHGDGAAARAAADRAVDWLLANEIRFAGDWADRVVAEPAGWCFEYANRFYPDVDDTAMVVIALATWRSAEPASARRESVDAAISRAVPWLAAMQNADGGWGAFDRDNNSEFLCKVPFADHNAMIDPSSPDLAGRVLEAFGKIGLRPGHPAVDRGLAYVRRSQEADGGWYGRWGVNYVYGTWQVLEGLRAIGIALDVGGTELPTVLDELARSVRAEQLIRREAVARQSWIKHAARLGSVAPWIVVVMLATRPDARDAFSSAAGAALLVACAGATVVAFVMMSALGRLPDPPRWALDA